MAVEFRTITATTIEWRITGLSNPFTTAYYAGAGGTSVSFTSPRITEPPYTFAPKIPSTGYSVPTSGTSTSTPWMTRTGLIPGTSYDFYAWVKVLNATPYYYSGYGARATLPATCGIPGLVSVTDRTTPTTTTAGLTCAWTASSTAGVTYRLQYTNVASGSVSYTTTTSNLYASISANMIGGTSYNLQVRAEKSGYTSSAYTTIQVGTTLPYIPPSVTNHAVTSVSIEVGVGSLYGGGCTDIYARLYNASGTSLLDYGASVEGGTVVFSGLTPSTTYLINSESRYYVNGTSLFSSYNSSNATDQIGRSAKVSFTTSAVPSAPTISFSSRTTNSLTFTRGTSSGATSYNSYKGTTLYASGIGTTFTISSLSAGTSYSIGVTAEDSGGSESSINSLIKTTLCVAPSLTFNSATSNSLSFTRNNVTGGQTYQIYKNGIYYADSASTTFTVSGLSGGTSYDIGIAVTNMEGALSATTTLTETTLSARPTNWTGFVDIISGNSFLSYNSITKVAYPMTAVEWNNFTDKINLFRIYKSLSSYSFTQVSTDTSFTATIINQAISKINDMGFSQSTISNVNNISASVFQTMKSNLNSII